MRRLSTILSATNQKPQRSKRNARVGVESMEGRQLMTGGLLTPVAPIRFPITLPADLDVVSLNVQNLPNNQYKLTAKLENGTSNLLPGLIRGTTYPGGGVFQITQSTGGTILPGPPNGQPSLFGLAQPDLGHVIASMPIPSISYGSTIQLSTVVNTRAIFTAAAVPIFNSSTLTTTPLPEVNVNNDSLTLDTLIKLTITVNTATINLLPQFQNAIANAQIVLNGSNSSINIPGLLNDQFSIPGQSVSVWPISTTYNVNNLHSTSVALGYANGGLEITIDFANNSHALHTSSILPDVGVKNLVVTVDLPLSYSAQYQYFLLGQPQVKVSGNWSFNGPASLLNGLLPNIDSKFQSAIVQAITPQLNLMSYQVTSQIHALTTGGRIDSANIQQNQMILTIETPSGI